MRDHSRKNPVQNLPGKTDTGASSRLSYNKDPFVRIRARKELRNSSPETLDHSRESNEQDLPEMLHFDLENRLQALEQRISQLESQISVDKQKYVL